MHDGLVADGVLYFQLGIVELIVHQAMMPRVESGYEGIVIGKRLAGERRDHPFGRCALADELFKIRKVKTACIVVAKPVKRDEHDVR